MLNKIRFYTMAGITLAVQAVSCFALFCVTLREKKNLASALFALCVAFGAAGSILLTLASNEEEKRIERTKRKLAVNDHWFHNFEYPSCSKVKMTVEDTYFPPVETEDE